MEHLAGEIQPWLGQSFRCSCGADHKVPIRKAVIEKGALDAVAAYAGQRGYTELLLVADKRTLEAAGRRLLERCEAAGLKARLCVLTEDEHGELAADERILVQLLLQVLPSTQAIVAVGSGTIHDAVRFVAHKTNRVFLSVPTAPSVDGFSSVGAPLIIGGFKQTIPACSPEAIFADLELLSRSPRAMIAAGFGDMLGKYTSLADWQLGRVLFDEPYCELAAEMTRQGLALCVDHADEIAAGTELGCAKLMKGLTLSGISMLLVGNSRPASGAEHHLSHYWEMRFLTEKRRALLHGAKVGVAAVQMAERFARAAQLTAEEAAAAIAAHQAAGDIPSLVRARAEIEAGYSAGIVDSVLSENGITPDSQDAEAYTAEQEALARRIAGQWDVLRSLCAAVPAPEVLAELLQRVGGPVETGQLGVEPELLQDSLHYAMYVRNRYTILRLGQWL